MTRRWHNILYIVLVLLLGAIAATILFDQLLHRTRIIRAAGIWREPELPSGDTKRIYGDGCQ